jgi:hypothetical protein
LEVLKKLQTTVDKYHGILEMMAVGGVALLTGR